MKKAAFPLVMSIGRREALTVRHAIRISWVTMCLENWVANQATVSSKA